MRAFVASSLLAGAAFAAPPIPQGFEFLGFGYDLLTGNALDTRGFGDLGYRSNIFELTTTEGKVTDNNLWSIPDKTTAMMTHACAQDLTNKTIRSTKDYLDGQNVTFDLNFSFSPNTPFFQQGDAGLGKIAFVFSVDTHDVHTDIEQHADIFYLESFQCATYTLSLNLFDHPKVSDNFCMGLEFLPSKYSESEYMMFIQEFGTHVIHHLEAGGRWGWQVMIKYDDVNRLDNEGHNVDVGLNIAAKISAGFEVKSDKDMRHAETVTKYISKNATFNIGGDFSADPDEWQKSVAEKPMPVHVSYIPLYNLASKMYCPSGSDLDAKKVALADAMNYKYCPYMKKQRGDDYGYVKCPEEPTEMVVV